MPFIHPAIFWTGLIAASIPIIIHLLNRRRFRLREWAAMKFLLESIRKNRRRIRIEEIILLAIRTLVLVLLALAIGRFTGCGQNNVLSLDKAASTYIYVLDDSPSMGQKIGAGTLFAAATTDLCDQIKKMPKGDKLGIVLTSRPDGSEAFVNPDFIRQEGVIESTVSRLQGLKPSDMHTRIVDGMAAAEAMLAGDSSPNKQICLIGDWRKVDFTREHNEALRKKVAELRKQGIKIVVIDYGRDCAANLTIDAIELMDKFAVAKQPANMRLTVRNNGPTRVQDAEVRIRARFPAGEELKEVAIPVQTIGSIEPGEIRHMEFQVKIPQAGSAVVTAELQADDLAADNVASLAVEARDAIRVLIVDGSYDVANPLACESYFFNYALDPNRDGSYGTRTDVIGVEALGNVHLDDYDLVVLMNVPIFPIAGADSVEPYPHLVAMEQYVLGGGGLGIFTGDKINLEFYGPTDEARARGRFYNNGLGLLPMPLTAPPTEKKPDFWRLDPASLGGDSLLKTFIDIKRQGQDPTRLVRIMDFNPALEVASAAASQTIKQARVLARFDDPRNSAAIVAREYGKGTVVMFCTTAGSIVTRWNDWPLDEVGTYAAAMNDLVTYLARPARSELTAKVGEPILYEVPSRYRESKLTLKTPLYPGEDLLSLSAKMIDGRNMLRYDKQRTAGVYWLTLEMPDKSRKEVLLAQNVDGVEGQLTAGQKPEIAPAFGGEKEFIYVDRTSPTAATQVQSQADKEYWMWAIAAMLALLAAETFLGQRFGHYAQ